MSLSDISTKNSDFGFAVRLIVPSLEVYFNALKIKLRIILDAAAEALRSKLKLGADELRAELATGTDPGEKFGFRYTALNGSFAF